MTGEAAATVRTDARPPESSKHYAGWRVVAACFVIDLPEIGGADKLRAAGVDVRTLLAFEGH